MSLSRILALAAFAATAPLAVAQEGSSASAGGTSGGTSGASGASGPGGGGSSDGSSTGAASSFGSATPSNPAVYTPPPGTSTSPTGFGTGIGTGTAVQAGQEPGTEIPGGLTGAAAQAEAESPTSFSISTGYGRAPEVFVSGEGRLARPRFSTRISSSIGFDDNIFQTPTKSRATPEQVIEVPISAAIPAQVGFVEIPNTAPRRLGPIQPAPQRRFRRVVIPAQAAQFEEIVIPGTPKQERQVSAVSRASLSLDAQVATRRTVFTLDANINADYFWNREPTKEEYNGSLALRFLHRLTPRLQVTASLDASYLSQPALTQLNAPTDIGAGNFWLISAKSDLSYRWTPRISTVTSVAYNQLRFDDPLRQFGDFAIMTIGTELRYLWSPKISAVLEGRYAMASYPQQPALDSFSYYALIGFDLRLSRRASANVRVGGSLQKFDLSGRTAAAPYLEASLNYQLGRASVLSWNNRFGFEEPGSPTAEVLGLRTGVSVTHFFGPRLRGSLGLNGIFRRTTDDLANTELNETTLDSSLSLLYTLTRAWTFNLNYSYATVFVEPGDNDFFRNRIFAGFDYSF